MQSFLDSLITYLDAKFEANTTLEKKPLGEYAYSRNEPDAVTPFYAIGVIDDSLSNEDFNNEIASLVSIQIFLYGVKMKVGDEIKTAQEVSYILSDLCKDFMKDYKYSSSDILELRRTGSTPAMPYEKGDKAYYSVLRYNIKIKE